MSNLRTLALRPVDATRLRDLLRDTDAPAPHRPVRDAAAPRRMFRITDTTAIGGASYRWRYTLVEVVFDFTTEAWVDLDGGIETSAGYNLAEAGNTATVAGGVLVDALPAGWDLYPVGRDRNGDLTGAVVMAEPRYHADGVLWVFDRAGAIDGECEA